MATHGILSLLVFLLLVGVLLVALQSLDELQLALERMRHKLRETTITKNYLNSVLTGMTDAVFVPSPDGVIRIANQAAQRLLGLELGLGLLGQKRHKAVDLYHHLGADAVTGEQEQIVSCHGTPPSVAGC